MPTPSIQTLRTDAQQVLNLDSISAVRSVVAATLANANAGTPLNPNLTTQQLWNEFYQIVTQPKSDIESIIANQLMKFLYAPPAPGGAGADKQVIFNDGGVLAGDPQFLWNKTTNLLTVTGSATITGDLTVDTNTLKVDSANNRVGIVNASPTRALDVVGSAIVSSEIRCASFDTGTTSGDLYLFTSNRLSQTAAPTIECQNSSKPLIINHTGSQSMLFGIGGTTAMTLNSTGLGIGGGPASTYKFQSTQTSTSYGGWYLAGLFTSPTATMVRLSCSTPNLVSSIANDGDGGFKILTNGTLTTVGSESLVVTPSGNVGIGVTPSAGGSNYYKTLEIGKAGCGLFTSTASLSASELTYFSGNGVLAYNAGPEWKYGNNGAAAIYGIEDGVHKWYNATTGTAGVVFVPTQAMTLDASGNLLVGTTSQASNEKFSVNTGNTTGAVFKNTGEATYSPLYVWNATTTGDGYFSAFFTEASATLRGSISYNRAGGLVAYNTTSDYRAKDIIGPVSDSGSLIDSLKVYVGKMKGATIERPMLIAHEAQAVAPYAVTGTKDEVDADGNPKYQQMDASSLVPLLIAEIQSLRARVQTLEAK